MVNTALITFWSLLIPRLWDVPWNSASYENPSNKQVKRVNLLLLLLSEVFTNSFQRRDGCYVGWTPNPEIRY